METIQSKKLVDENGNINLLEIYKQSHELLMTTLGDELTLPVDVNMIAEKLNIYLCKQALNGFDGKDDKFKGRFPMLINYFKDDFFGDGPVCLLESEIDPNIVKVGLARVTARYFLSLIKDNEGYAYTFGPTYYDNNCHPMDLDEVVLDMFANFILMPPHLVLGLYNKYMAVQMVGECSVPKHWLKYCSLSCCVPYETAVAGYYQTRNLCALLGNIKDKDDDLLQEKAVQKVIGVMPNKNSY